MVSFDISTIINSYCYMSGLYKVLLKLFLSVYYPSEIGYSAHDIVYIEKLGENKILLILVEVWEYEENLCFTAHPIFQH